MLGINIFKLIYKYISKTMANNGVNLLRFSLAIVYIWFGALKISGISPAEELVAVTIYWIPAKIFVPFLGYWEVAMGIGLLIERLIPFTIMVMLFHLAGTLLPFIIVPNLCFVSFPFVPTLVGQYIIKNAVLVSATLTISSKYMVDTKKN